jgi:hypothetical protein
MKTYCIDCGNMLHDRAFEKGTKRCMSCTQRERFKNPKNHPRFINGNRSISRFYCMDCGNEIDRRGKRCRSCAHKGRLGSNYQHGNGNYPYPADFTKKLKREVFQRDNFTCQNCNTYPCIHLTSHHIDYNRSNNLKNNLITLCMSCNIKANYNREYWQGFYVNKINDMYAIDLGQRKQK